MNPETMTSLRASIALWEGNAIAGTHAEISEVTALCHLFLPDNNILSKNACAGCPVVEKTGALLCVRTPFYDATELLREWWATGLDADRDAWRGAAQKYADFLKSLLPENTK